MSDLDPEEDGTKVVQADADAHVHESTNTDDQVVPITTPSVDSNAVPQVTNPSVDKILPAANTTLLPDPDSQPEKSVSPAPNGTKPKKKRLTLQERLALATKSKEASKKKELEAQIAQSPEPSVPDTDTQSNTPIVSKEPSPVPTEPDTHKVLLLTKENERLKAEIAKLQNNKLNQELQKKDEVIEQLMKEGEQLSIKELKLNETIKKLKASNVDYETVIEEFNAKNEEQVSKVAEVEDIMKRAKIKTFEELNTVISQYSKWKSDGIESQLKKTEGDLVKETRIKNEKIKEINDLKIQLEMLKESQQIELSSKEEVINNLRLEIKNLNLVNSLEVIRLENKIESLILQNENKSNGKSELTDSEDYSKLYKNYTNLQSEILTLRSNWELVEINLNSKISDLTSKIGVLKKDKVNLINDNKNLKLRLNEYDLQISNLTEQIKNQQSESTAAKDEVTNYKTEVESLKFKLEKINEIYNKEKEAFVAKINDLKAQVAELEETQQHSLAQSIINEPLEPPLISMDTSLYQSHNISSHSLNSLDFDVSSNHPNSLNITSNQPGSLQLVNKMSSTIRNLKVELNSLKDENEQILQDKDTLELKLLKLSKETAEIELLKNRILELEQQLESESQKQDRLLILLGEKEERVEELVNDVQDLKELCKLQVQQMIELQEKSQ